VTLDVPEPVPDLSDRVAALLPDAVVVHVNEIVANRRLVPAEDLDTGGHEPTLVEHFRGYLDAQGTRAAAADRVLEGFSRFYDALAAEEEPSFPEERLLLDDVEPADAEGDTTGACIDAASPDGDRPVVPVQMQLAGMEPSEPGSSTPPRRRR
jgi:hypothetical protein